MFFVFVLSTLDVGEFRALKDPHGSWHCTSTCFGSEQLISGIAFVNLSMYRVQKESEELHW
jgi:hypothetical protein